MIRIYLFTYGGDADEAIACVRCAKAAIPESVITVVDDEAVPAPPEARRALVAYGARYRQSIFERNGNLNGPECVRGIISTLARDAADDDIVVKIDSDTALLNGAWIRDMAGSGIHWCASGADSRQFYGLCYAMTGLAAKRAAAVLMQAELPPNAPEDLTIGRTVIDLFGVGKGKIIPPWTPQNRAGRWSAWNWFSVAVTPEKYAGFDVVTVGSPRPPHISKADRARVMNALFRYRFHKKTDHLVDVNKMIVLGKEG